MNKRKSDELNQHNESSPTKKASVAGNGSVETGRESSSETLVALRELASLFPEEIFLHRVPRVVMKHMVYSRLANRTKADKEMDELQQKGIIRLFKLGGEQESLAVLFTDQYIKLIESRCSKLPIIKKFCTNIVQKIQEVAIEKCALQQAGITEDDIKTLVNDCLLTLRTTSSYWFCFPGAGEFMKAYLKGRQSVLSAVRKSKYQQILQTELVSRNMKKTVRLGVTYHIHDIIGADLVSCVNTTSGQLLRISK